MGAMASQITSLMTVLLNRLFRRRSKKITKLRVTGLCEGNSPMTDAFPAQRASNADNGSIWWHYLGELCHRGLEPLIMVQKSGYKTGTVTDMCHSTRTDGWHYTVSDMIDYCQGYVIPRKGIPHPQGQCRGHQDWGNGSSLSKPQPHSSPQRNHCVHYIWFDLYSRVNINIHTIPLTCPCESDHPINSPDSKV